MLDFLHINEEDVQKRGIGDSYIRVYPNFQAIASKDLMVKGKEFYCVWDEERNLWYTKITELVHVVDRHIAEHLERMSPERRAIARPEYLVNSSNGGLEKFHRYVRSIGDNFKQINQTILFSNDTAKREDYSTQKLDYPLEKGSTDSYTEMMTLLFPAEELHKLEWSIGAIVTGESKKLQKFMVLYGAPGTGKSTFIDLLEELFQFYAKPYKASDLGNSSRAFAMEQFKDSPLVAFDHDGSLAKLDDNTVLNQIISHDASIINEKGKSLYSMQLNTLLYLGTNKHVRITDMQSGLMRRLIDAHVSKHTHEPETYRRLVEGMKFELGAIAYHCKQVFKKAGKDYYGNYVPTRMIFGTNTLHNFVDIYRLEFEQAEYTSRKQAFMWYKDYVEDANERFRLPLIDFGEELKTYFREFRDRDQTLEGRPRHVYLGFRTEIFEAKEETVTVDAVKVPALDKSDSLVDEMLKDCPAQYASSAGTPLAKWEDVKTTLSDLDTTKLHYVKPPLNHIVIDFDLTDEEGNKSRERNLEAIEQWPVTYAEFSKSGNGVHLHYLYVGDTERLSRVYSPGVEIKVFVGNASLRRMRSRCSDRPVATLTSGLPQREERVIETREIKSETGLRRLVEKNLMKQVHPGTKPSMDFIHKILNDAYKTDLVWDLSDMKKPVTNFAFGSTNQAAYCLKLLKDIPFKSKQEPTDKAFPKDDRVVIFDIEVYPNLFVIVWKYRGDSNKVRMINPTAQEVWDLFQLKLMGYNNRKYDNHILYAAAMGYTVHELYLLSKKLINKERSPFGAAYGISYGDIYDFLSEKMSLKKWQLKLGIRHMELDLPWDEPVPDDMIDLVVEYCCNDVDSTEAVLDARHMDEVARHILSDLSGLPFNASTNTHSAAIMFGDNKNPHGEFIYTDLSETFPGYVFDWNKSTYRGLDPSEGGFVAAEPGMYSNITVFDVESMHPASIIALNLFGDEYTAKFKELVDARLAIKHGDYTAARKMLDGKLAKYLLDEKDAKALSGALKIVINSVYGLTSATYDNMFRDKRNIDNIVAKRGALFMIDLMFAVREKGYTVVHIKTDSIKVSDADESLAQFIAEFGARYGYKFEVEAIFEKFCLVNDAVYVGKTTDGHWETVGAQFKHPYVRKTLLTKEPITFDDLVEVKSVTTSLWLDFQSDNEPGRGLQFVGRAGAFVPVLTGGGDLKRLSKEDTYSFAVGTKGHKWVEAEVERAQNQGRNDNIDMTYFQGLVDKAYEQINKYGDPEWMLS